MEQEILSELQTIKILLWVIIGLICSCFVFFVATNIARNLIQIDALKREQFLSLAQALEDKGEYNQLIEYAKERQQRYPKDALTWWFLGVAYYKQENYSQALMAFAEMQNIDATLHKEIVEDYIYEIKGKMSGPKISDN